MGRHCVQTRGSRLPVPVPVPLIFELVQPVKLKISAGSSFNAVFFMLHILDTLHGSTRLLFPGGRHRHTVHAQKLAQRSDDLQQKRDKSH